MAPKLMFPQGVRLAKFEELPGSEVERELAWSRIQSAQIRAGFVLSESADDRFAFYSEANVHAHNIWDVFRDLCESLLERQAMLLMSGIDEALALVGAGEVQRILSLLEPHGYQLIHDGWLQFGLLHQDAHHVAEVLITPTKHFKLWFDNADSLRSIMQIHGVPEVETLQFIDEYPRTTSSLEPGRSAFQSANEFTEHMAMALNCAQGED